MSARIGHTLPPDAVAALACAIPAMGYAVALVRGPAAVVVVAAGRDPEPAARILGAEVLQPVTGGHLLAAVPLERAQALAAELAPEVAPSLREGVSTGQVWCLVLRAPNGSLTVPVTTTNTRRPSRRGAAN
jgi:hypothetical protein